MAAATSSNAKYMEWLNYIGKNPTSRLSYNAYLQQGTQAAPAAKPVSAYEAYKQNQQPTFAIPAQPTAPAQAAAPAQLTPDQIKQQEFAKISQAQQQYLANVLRGAAGNPAAMPLVYQAQQQIAQQTQEWDKAWDEAMARNKQAEQQQNYYNQQASTYQQQTAAYQQQAKAMEEANLQAQQNFLTSQQNTSNQFQEILKQQQEQQAALLQQQQEAAAKAAEQQRIALEQQRAVADSVVPLPQQSTAGFDFAGSRARRKRSASQLSTAPSSGYTSSSGLQIPR